MRYLLKLGPVEVAGHSTNVYLQVKPTGEAAAPAFSANDVDGLTELLEASAPGSPLRCEPALAQAAAQLGLAVEPAPLKAQSARAAIAVFMAWSERGVSSAGSDMAPLLMQAATEFWNAHPWMYWHAKEPISFSFEGSVNRTYEGSIFGSRQQGYGLALYEDKGALVRLAQLRARGDTGNGKDFPAIGVMLDDRPAYAISALSSANCVPRLPIPIKSGPSGPEVPTAVECVALAAAMRVVAALASGPQRATAEITARGVQLFVKAEAPPARIRN